jgi:hypothetical protein
VYCTVVVWLAPGGCPPSGAAFVKPCCCSSSEVWRARPVVVVPLSTVTLSCAGLVVALAAADFFDEDFVFVVVLFVAAGEELELVAFGEELAPFEPPPSETTSTTITATATSSPTTISTVGRAGELRSAR